MCCDTFLPRARAQAFLSPLCLIHRRRRRAFFRAPLLAGNYPPHPLLLCSFSRGVLYFYLLYPRTPLLFLLQGLSPAPLTFMFGGARHINKKPAPRKRCGVCSDAVRKGCVFAQTRRMSSYLIFTTTTPSAGMRATILLPSIAASPAIMLITSPMTPTDVAVLPAVAGET